MEPGAPGSRPALKHAAVRRWPLLAGVILSVLTLSTAVQAAHLRGLGNYEYEPGALRPHLRVTESVDGWRVDVSGYPGDPAPGEAVELLVKLEDSAEGRSHPGVVECTIYRVGVLGKRERVVDPITAGSDGMGHRFNVSLPDISEYEIVLAFRAGETRTSSLSFPMVAGRPGSPWTILAGFGSGLALFILGVVIAGGLQGRRWWPGLSS